MASAQPAFPLGPLPGLTIKTQGHVGHNPALGQLNLNMWLLGADWL